MIINRIRIKKFRGFANIEFGLGNHITVIAGQNGTQKTTVLGLLSHPFSIASPHVMEGERPLCGGSYRSSFAEKFKLSTTFDLPRQHEWTLELSGEQPQEFTLESIPRRAGTGDIRFWRKGIRTAGSGYIPVPVIYLSLSRLAPIGEDQELNSSDEVALTAVEFGLYKELHDEILIIHDSGLQSADYLASRQKKTLGANTDRYDWKMNSAGQDNIGKIILALLSFKRLKEQYPQDYRGGILAIDEADATLYPASQIKLLKVLRKYASRLNIQVLITTHSLSILKSACEIQDMPNQHDDVRVVYLIKRDHQIRVLDSPTFEVIQNKLNVSMQVSAKPALIPIFTEDKEAQAFIKVLLRGKLKNTKFIDCTMGGSNYIELAEKRIPGFLQYESIIILDGDTNSPAYLRKIRKHKNILVLPGSKSPEQLIATFLSGLSEESSIWDQISVGYEKQIAFRDHRLTKILQDRVVAKIWFNEQKQYWGANAGKVFKHVIAAHQEESDRFIESFLSLLNPIA